MALTPRQRRGIAAILSCPTAKAAAEKARVNPKTFTRWLEQPEFVAELKAAQVDIIDRAAGRLVHGLDIALNTLLYLMVKGQSESVRKSAASEWLSACLKLRELIDIERRLSDLEERL
jgi:hypothetical protein